MVPIPIVASTSPPFPSWSLFHWPFFPPDSELHATAGSWLPRIYELATIMMSRSEEGLEKKSFEWTDKQMAE